MVHVTAPHTSTATSGRPTGRVSSSSIRSAASTTSGRCRRQGGAATRVSHLGGVMGGFDATRAPDAFVFARSSETEGSDIYYLPAIGGPERRLTQLATDGQGCANRSESPSAASTGSTCRASSTGRRRVDDGQRCPGAGAGARRRHNSYTRSQNLIEQYLASKGFVVLAINYRGGSGSAASSRTSRVNDWLNGQARDPGAAADFCARCPTSTARSASTAAATAGCSRWPRSPGRRTSSTLRCRCAASSRRR